MGSNELHDFEKELLLKGEFIWEQNILVSSQEIIAICDTNEKIKKFFDDCIHSLKNPESHSRYIWNNEVYASEGNKFGYLCFF